MSKIPRFFYYNSGKKRGYGDDFNIFGLLSSRATNPQKISFLGGPAHFVTYGGDDGGDGLVDNNNALTTMASALKKISHSAFCTRPKSGKNTRRIRTALFNFPAYGQNMRLAGVAK
jgi:hypothetical protein